MNHAANSLWADIHAALHLCANGQHHACIPLLIRHPATAVLTALVEVVADVARAAANAIDVPAGTGRFVVEIGFRGTDETIEGDGGDQTVAALIAARLNGDKAGFHTLLAQLDLPEIAEAISSALGAATVAHTHPGDTTE